jgi:peptide/nickel transport system substrate-binding protein/oligopeptide transport system substrate-binding protein
VSKVWRGIGLVALALVFVIPALTFASSKGSPPVPPTPARPDLHRQTLRLAMPDAAATVDPALVADEENVQLADLLYSGLVRLDASYNVVPDAAAGYRVSPDHRTYTFYLRKGLKFSNGDPVTAGDFRYSITRSLSPALKSPSAPVYLQDIQGAAAVLSGKATSVSGIHVVDPQTLQITTVWPVPYFLMELTYPTSFVLDQKRIAKLGPPDNTAWYASPVGSGPFKLKSWTPNAQMILTPNPHYYGAVSSLKSVSISLGGLPDTGLYQYVTHNLDVVGLPAYQTSLLHDPGIHRTKMLAVDGVYMNFKSKPFGNLHVRRALTLALDRVSLVQSSMGVTVTPFAGHVPPGQAGYDPQLRVPAYDPVTARSELAAAGASNLKALNSATLYYEDQPAIAKLAVALAKAWHKILKISIDTRPLILSTLLAKVQSGSLPLFLLGWSADYPDPHDFLSLQWKSDAPNNDVHFSDKAFDDLMATADVTWSYIRRMQLYDEGQQRLVDDSAWIPLYVPYRLVYVRPGVVNLVLTGYGLIPRTGSWSRVQIDSTPTKRQGRAL